MHMVQDKTQGVMVHQSLGEVVQGRGHGAKESGLY